MPTVNSLCNKYLYIHNKFPVEKRVNRRHFYIDEKNLQKFGLTGELPSVGNCVNRCFKVLNHS